MPHTTGLSSGGGGRMHHRDPIDEFTASSFTNARRDRDLHFAANPDSLSMFKNDPFMVITLKGSGASKKYESYVDGAWEERSK